HLAVVKAIHDSEREQGRGDVWLPFALARKYPKAPKEWGWQYVFPASGLSVDPRSGVVRRHHLDEKRIQRAFKRAVRGAGIVKQATPHTLRHSFAASAGVWARHPYGPGVTRPFGCENHDDLYPRAKSWRTVGTESSGSIVRDCDSLMSCNLPLISLLILAVAFAARLFI